jgi:hypothetical protein
LKCLPMQNLHWMISGLQAGQPLKIWNDPPTLSPDLLRSFLLVDLFATTSFHNLLSQLAFGQDQLESHPTAEGPRSAIPMERRTRFFSVSTNFGSLPVTATCPAFRTCEELVKAAHLISHLTPRWERG